MVKTGRVYCIQHKEKNEISYIGSTFETLNRRLQRHKNHYNEFIKNIIGRYACSVRYFKKYGVENFEIFLLKEYKVCDEKHLKVYEQLWINTSICINEKNPCPLMKVFEKEYKKKHYQDNKELILEQCKKYRQENKEEIKERKKKYREANKEKIKEKKSKLYNCICGSILTIEKKARHNKSIKHQKYLASNKEHEV